MWSEGICGDGAAILNDGAMIPIEEVVKALNERDRYREALEKIRDSANGFATCTVEYLEVIAEEALKDDA